MIDPLGVQNLRLSTGGKAALDLLNNNMYIVHVHCLSLFLTDNF